MSIAKPGYPIIIGSLIPGLILVGLYPVHHLLIFLIIGILALLFGMASLFFFRNPRRIIPADGSVLVAPADGKVLRIIEIDDEYVGPSFRVDIFLSVFDVHVNRIPADGTVEFVRYRPGKFLKAFQDKASEDNERTDVGISGTWGKCRVAQIAGLIARRIVCDVSEKDQVTKGQLFGMIRFGSRTELTFPRRFSPTVKPGQHVTGGETVVGKLTDHA